MKSRQELKIVEEEGPESGRALVSDAGYSVRVTMTADQARVLSQGWVSGISVVTEADQAALYGLLIRVRDLGLSLIPVHRIKPDVPVPQQWSKRVSGS